MGSFTYVLPLEILLATIDFVELVLLIMSIRKLEEVVHVVLVIV
jgi:hypothetical protein